MAANKKARLGRGLGALLGDVKRTAATVDTSAADAPSRENLEPPPLQQSALSSIPIEQLQRGRYQPRLNMDQAALEELASSIRRQGVIQPLLVRPLNSGGYEIVAGERRWRGAQLAGLSSVPAVVRDMPDQTAMAVALIENIQRQDLNAIEEAQGLARLLDEFGLTHQEAAEAVGRSRTAVSNLLRLLRLPPEVRSMVEQGTIDMGHARALLALSGPQQLQAARQIVAAGLSVRSAEQLIRRLQKTGDSRLDNQGKSPDIAQLEDRLSKKIGARVSIEHGAKKGRLIIQYHSLDELDGILKRIN